uniref:Putative salivary short d7 protein 3 n=2 Tax=Culex tarsalis TaxID=7177 RepID=A0A1Q3FBV7_CULTA
MKSWRVKIFVAIISISATQAIFNPLGIEEFYIKSCDLKIVSTSDKHHKCLIRKFEIKMDVEENRKYIKCMFEKFGYYDQKGEFNKQALIKDYHHYGIKTRDKEVLDSFDGCMKQYGPTLNPVKLLHCVTRDKDFPKVINARRERNDYFKPEWMQALCGGMSLG